MCRCSGPCAAPAARLRATSSTTPRPGDFNQPNKAFAAALVLLGMVLIINVFVDIFGRKARELKWT